ncbi:potassium-transporting ATPase subunit C [Actinacidiphila oryziradicis]|uniref:potassium-transporting ATPase subunit C n=1 Tax=Actinacidiphila oryziradicis TaxID=2571141 RepID=UPI002AFF46E8|nr:potassium-transporting ATPase subunit C [Actinacidiphila oryziradicis]
MAGPGESALRAAFPDQTDGRTVGSALIGQNFSDKNGTPLPQYFQPRPSAAGPNGYNPTSGGASTLGPGDPASSPSARPSRPPMSRDIPRSTRTATPSTNATPTAPRLCNPNTVPQRALAYRKPQRTAPRHHRPG